jgi:hypothetical protein
MPRDHFKVLGLSIGRHPPHVVDQHFAAARGRLVPALSRSSNYMAARRELEALYIAYRVLRDSGRQAAYLQDLEAASRGDLTPRESELRRLVGASLEGGLVRQSRREYLVERGRELGFSEFHVHLVIAQAMIGDDASLGVAPRRRARGARTGTSWRDYAAIGALAVAVFVLLIRWVHV